MSSRDRNLATELLGAARIVAGAASWLAPTATWSTLGLANSTDDPGITVLARLFGVRDVVLGAQVLLAVDKPAQRTALADPGWSVPPERTGPRGCRSTRVNSTVRSGMR